MKYIKLYENMNGDDISIDLMNKLAITHYQIENGCINIDGSIDISHVLRNMKRNKLKRIKFGKVTGSFICKDNNLDSIELAPYYVGGNFICSHNKLKSLEGSPNKVGRDFICSYNELETLLGGPKYVGRHYNCTNNILRDVCDFPKNFYVDENHQVDFSWNPVNQLFIGINIKHLGNFIDYINEYDVIRDGKYVVRQRLEQAYYDAFKEKLGEIILPSYEFT